MGETVLPYSVLDAVLALQITVAWAGESGSDGNRLGWWNGGLTDDLAGGDFFSRTTPATAGWAMLDACRRSAIMVDRRQRREHLASPDQVRTIFHLGYALDEALAERLRLLKQMGGEPAASLAMPLAVDGPFDRMALDRFLESLGDVPSPRIAPAGREMPGRPPESVEILMRHLVGALRPLPGHYPMPYYRVPAMPTDHAR